MAESRAIVSMAYGAPYQQLADLTFPTIRRYSEACSADFIVLGRRVYRHIHYEKFQLHRLLETYNRALWIDPDVIVRADAPDLFDIVHPYHFAAYNEIGNHPEGQCAAFVAGAARLLGAACPPCPHYLNLGVHLQSRAHRALFATPEGILPGAFPEQDHLNYRLLAAQVPVHFLGSEWNCMGPQQAGRTYWTSSYFIHHSFQPLASKIERIRADLARWESFGVEGRERSPGSGPRT